MLRPIVPYIQFHLRQIARLHICPYEWKEGSPYPTLVKPKKNWQDYRVNLALNAGYGVVMTGNYLWTLGELTVSQKILAVLFIGVSNVAITLRLNFAWKEGELVHLLVSLVRFEGRNRPVSAPSANGQFITKLIAAFAIISVPTAVVLICALLYARPCMAPALEYILLGGAGTCDISRWMRIPIILFDAYIWLTNVPVGTFYLFQCCFGVMRCLDGYLRNVKQLLEGYSAQGYRQGIRKYRQIQLLNVRFNEAFQAVFIPCILLCVWIHFAVSMYACVKLHDRIDMPEFAMFPFLLLCSLLAAFVVKVAANVIDQSEKCLEVARKNERFGRKLLFKRMIRSVGKIRVRFGSTNYVDQLTPFNLLNEGLDTCVNLMLLS